MTCQHCGAALPPIAMFCGECGRSVSAAPPPAVHRPVMPTSAPVAMPWSADAPLSISAPSPAAPPDIELACESCGSPAAPGDLFCGECGKPLAAHTRVIEPIAPAEPEPTAVVESQPVAPSEPQLMATPEPQPVAAPEPQPAVAPESQSVVPAEPQTVAPANPQLIVAPHAAVDDVEATRLVPRGSGGARFVLQFSTGESYTVTGSGLAGRNPRPEPTEVVDHVVTIVDPGRSVSKTHLEFGQEAGVFWVCDRHSGNGSVIREPGEPPRPCEPGRRYPVVRGTRIDMGEQFVIVS